MKYLFKSKKLDTTFKAMYIAIFVILIVMPIIIYITEKEIVPFIILELLFGSILFILFLVNYYLRIIIDGNYLIIKIIFLLFKADISKITKIRKGETMWSGFHKYGTTTKGLIIFTKYKDDLYITPENEEDFLKKILEINPNIIIEKI
jgi:hypothetical protein